MVVNIKKLIIIDDLLEIGSLKSFLEKVEFDKFENKWFYMDKPETYTKHIINIGADHFPIAGIVGYETWTHKNTRPESDKFHEWHYDKDEYRYSINQILRFPIFSAVFYIKIDCSGGNLIMENGVEIKPKTNRLVLFEPGLKHRVEKFEGTRYSININPWRRRLEAYK